MVVLRRVSGMAKVDGVLRPFRGRQDEFDEFWKKFNVVARIQKWEDAEARMNHLPLYLSGDAFSVWSEMSESDQMNEETVKERLQKSFSMLPGEAYAQFGRRHKRMDETVDAYLSDLRRLLRIAGHKVADDGKDPMLIEQFLAGLPAQYAGQLRLSMAASVEGLTVEAVANQARALCASGLAVQEDGRRMVAAAASASQVCYFCQEVGHLRRDCPKRKTQLRCFRCKELGHVRQNCPQLRSRKMESANAVVCPPTTVSQDRCLALTAKTGVSLPRIYVYADGCDARLRAAVDSCSNRSLMSMGIARANAIPVMPAGDCPITAIDGSTLKIVGKANLSISRDDEHVHLPPISAEFLVVETLDAVPADLLVGLDIISSAGGVRLDYGEEPGVLTQVVFGERPVVAAASEAKIGPRSMPRHVTVEEDELKVLLKTDDGEAMFDKKNGVWEVGWKWKSGEPPTSAVGSGIGEYSRKRLADDQEAKFRDEIAMWIDNEWLVPYDASQHGPIGAVLPLIAVCQEHKPTTPVRPCLDYRALNDQIVSYPGTEAPACGEKLREWRQRRPESALVDIRKAYLNVRIRPDLQRFQVVAFEGRLYVMERMGFGLSIAPKMMDLIVKWALRDCPDTDNYIDDIITPDDQAEAVAATLNGYGLPTKPASALPGSHVLGLKLTSDNALVRWCRRECDLKVEEPVTKRNIFRWCGRLTGHYPVCGWLRPVASWLKRVATSVAVAWDDPVPPELQELCLDLQKRVWNEDPVAGVWSASPSSQWKVWCDASNIAYGVVLEADGAVVEDQSWLRPADDKRHINVAELDAVIKGLTLAVSWGLKDITLLTDSQTVFGWLGSLLNNTQRVKVSGLHEVVVKRRLQVISDTIDASDLSVDVEWVSTRANVADKLTRVPDKYLALWKAQSRDDRGPTVAAAATEPEPSVVLLRLDDIRAKQSEDAMIAEVVKALESGEDWESSAFKKVRTQLSVVDGMLQRSVKLPPNDVQNVPVIPLSLEKSVIRAAHQQTGHASWETTCRFLSSRCYFPSMSSKCQEFVKQCQSCSAANAQRGSQVPPSRPETPSRPWSTVYMDTLELGSSRSGRFHCVLVMIDPFTKWVEVVPLKRHDAASVAAAFLSVCVRWGPPGIVRSDNGLEFRNALTHALFEAFGVVVQHGAVRHPQSQGSVERFNKTLLTIIRKTLDGADDWEDALDLLLFHYRIRPHSATKVSPMRAMYGWEPNVLIESRPEVFSSSVWVDRLERRAAEIRDYLEEQLSQMDWIEDCHVCPYLEGDSVLLRQPERRQKRQAPYETGWVVSRVVAPSTVRIVNGQRSKLVNIDLIKMDPSQVLQHRGDVDDEPVPLFEPAVVDDDDDAVVEDLPASPLHRMVLRDRRALQPPLRYQ